RESEACFFGAACTVVRAFSGKVCRFLERMWPQNGRRGSFSCDCSSRSGWARGIIDECGVRKLECGMGERRLRKPRKTRKRRKKEFKRAKGARMTLVQTMPC